MNSPKKSLGQNFLTSGAALAKIIEAAEIGQNDVVLEAGPGHGTLTKELILRAKTTVSVEKDQQLVAELTETFKNTQNLTLISGDILDFDPKTTFGTTPYKIVANIPYYITGQFIRKFLETDHQPQKMVLLVQKEVAERIVARDEKESLLSISVKAFGTPRYVATVKAGSFYPKPKVNSAIIEISNISRAHFTNKTEETAFFDILHRGFAHKRKLLTKNLGVSPEILEKSGIAPKSRAENLSVADWLKLKKQK